MTREEAIKTLKENVCANCAYCMPFDTCDMSYCDNREAIKVLEQEPCEDCISRKSIKHKLQEQHDFFVNAHGGFSNLPQNDKSRVDEIINCIAMVVNEPSVQPKPKTGHWIMVSDRTDWYDATFKCSCCSREITMPYELKDDIYKDYPYCHCGAKMESEGKE